MKETGRCILFFILVTIFTLVLVNWTNAIENGASPDHEQTVIETVMPSDSPVDDSNNPVYLSIGNSD